MRLAVLAFTAVTLTACASAAGSTPQPSPSPVTPVAVTPATVHGLKQVHDPGHVTGTITGHCAYRDKGQLPDPRCTPGSIDPAVTQADIHSTICRPGYTKTVRPPGTQTGAFKFNVAYPAYSVPRTVKTELDHLVPLELGGSNDATNLWPETPPTPNPKDKVEDALNRDVCSGRISLTAAQQAIATDWTTAFEQLTKVRLPVPAIRGTR